MHAYVALLLSAASSNQANYRVIPYISLELPFKRKGHLYQADYIITATEQELAST